jgi:LysM repeat protein
MLNSLSLLVPSIALAWAQPPGKQPPPLGVSTAQVDEMESQVKKAEDLYEAGLRKFKSGDVEAGRAELRKAFDIVLANLEDDAVPESLKPEFSSMLDKLRLSADWEYSSDDQPNVETPEQALDHASTTTVVMRGIKVDADNPITQKFIDLYTKRRAGQAEDALGRSGRYKDMIQAALKEKGLPPELFYLVMAESEYKPNAISRSRAAGLWQFMSFTARKYGLEVNYWVDERFDPEKATKAAVQYLSDLYQWFGDWNLAIAAYNRGEGGLGRDMQYSHALDFDNLSSRNALPNETHLYVPKFNACILMGENPEKYGLHPDYDKPLEYDNVPIPRELDLSVAAKCAQTTEDIIHELNPQLRAWCTPKDRPDFQLRIPKGSKEAFLANLAKVQDWNPGPALVRYRVQRGDVLGKIARRHHTTVRAILEMNKLRSARHLRPGMTLVIRPTPGHHGRRHRSAE